MKKVRVKTAVIGIQGYAKVFRTPFLLKVAMINRIPRSAWPQQIVMFPQKIWSMYIEGSSFLLKYYQHQAQKTGYCLETSNDESVPSCFPFAGQTGKQKSDNTHFSNKLLVLFDGTSSLTLSWSKCSLTYFVAVGIILGHISMQFMHTIYQFISQVCPQQRPLPGLTLKLHLHRHF